MLNLITVDLGNESGRIMRVSYADGQFKTHEVYRFLNQPVTVRHTLYWDILRLWHEIQQGLGQALREPAAGIAVDSFGVDFGLLDQHGQLIGNPVHMRDQRTQGMMEWVLERIPRETLFQRTGIGFYVINTLYQLVALSQQAPWQLENARHLLTVPNLINYWLSGEIASEFTHSTTTQCYDPTAATWDEASLHTLNIPTTMFPTVVQPAIQLGRYQQVPLFTVGSHDTASAVAAVPTETPYYAYISSGTWSLMGVEVPAPVTTSAAMQANFTNEGGVGGTFRLLKMVMGLWLLQQCRAAWRQAGLTVDYTEMIQQALLAPPFYALIDPDDPDFFAPGDMPARIHAFCQRTGQPTPDGVGATVRCVLESLALKYRQVVEQLIAVTGQPIEVVHIVGGGVQNALLCQMTANACGRPVLAGPIEATSLGNALVQLIALGELTDLRDGRAAIRHTLPSSMYQPQDFEQWTAAYQQFVRLSPAQ